MNSEVVKQVAELFVVIIVGIYAGKKNYITKEINRALSKLLLNVTLPFLVLSSFFSKYSKELLLNAGVVLISAFIINILLAIIGKFIFIKYDLKEQQVLRFITVFSNCGFMGYPMLAALYGPTGIFYGAIFNVVFNIFMFSFGIMLFTNKKNLKEMKNVVKNPVLFAILLGLIIFCTSLNLPVFLTDSIKMIGTMTTPLSMLILGAMLSESKLREVFQGRGIFLGSFVRLIIAPILTFYILKFFGIGGMMLHVMVLLEAMPAATNTAVMAEEYGGDEIFSSKCVFLSTIFSIITIPLILNIL